MRKGFDVAQICKNGHRITGSYLDFPEFRKAFCPQCGEPTITACPACNAPIKGSYREVFSVAEEPVPSFCDACGMAYPWQIVRVANALELLRLRGVGETEVAEIEKNLADITRDTPRSQAAALRVRMALERAGKPIYDIGVKVIGDVAVATVKAHLGL
jgi:hypothetical protein